MKKIIKPKVICIIGPTASGKTKLSIELAKKIDGEIISADSMQIYKELSIGTAKVTKEEMQGVPHHLVDFVSPGEDFSVAQFKELAIKEIEDIILRNKVPIIVGGTGLYVSSIILDMNFEDEAVDEEYRNSLYRIAEEKGNEYIHEMLKKVDIKSAEEIHPNNLKRVIRALEMNKNGNTKSVHMEEENKKREKNESKYDFKVFCTYYPKQLLHERINLRVDNMIKEGLEKEARKVYKLKSGTLRQAVGYKEFFDYFEKKKSLEEVIEEIKLRTRQYAKRQNTWFKKMDNVNYVDMRNSIDENIEKIMEIVYE